MQWIDVAYDRFLELAQQNFPNDNHLAHRMAASHMMADAIRDLSSTGEITPEEISYAESRYGFSANITPLNVAGSAANHLRGAVSSSIGAIGSEISDMQTNFRSLHLDAISTSQEDGSVGVDDRVWDDNLADNQDSSIDLWDEISVEREISVDDDISVEDDIDVTEETEVDEEIFYDPYFSIPDLNPADDDIVQEILYPVEYDIKEDDIEDLLGYNEQEIDDAVAWLDESNPFDEMTELISDDQYTPDILRIFQEQQDQDPFESVIDLPTQTDDTFADIVNELTEDHMGVTAFQFFDSDNIIFDRFAG